MKARIVGARETVELSPAGELVRIAVYNFTLDGLGPFEHRVPVTEDIPEKLKEAIRKKEDLIKAATIE